MNAATLENRASSFARTGKHFVLVVGLLASVVGCAGGGEGDRCIPSPPFSHNDCNEGLVCTTIVDPVSGATCGESYCCKPGSTNSNCNPGLIGPAPDGAAGICPIPPAMMTPTSSEAGDETGDDGSGDSSSPEASGD